MIFIRFCFIIGIAQALCDFDFDTTKWLMNLGHLSDVLVSMVGSDVTIKNVSGNKVEVLLPLKTHASSRILSCNFSEFKGGTDFSSLGYYIVKDPSLPTSLASYAEILLSQSIASTGSNAGGYKNPTRNPLVHDGTYLYQNIDTGVVSTSGNVFIK